MGERMVLRGATAAHSASALLEQPEDATAALPLPVWYIRNRLQRHHATHGATTFVPSLGETTYGGMMNQGYVPPGQFEDMLNLIRQAAAAADRAMNAAKYSEMAASAAGVAGQQAVVRAMHMANSPAAPAASPFSPGSPPDLGMPGFGSGTGTGVGGLGPKAAVVPGHLLLSSLLLPSPTAAS